MTRIIAQRRIRSERGQSLVVLILVLAVFLIGPLALVSYEMGRYELAKQQLKACVESCALAAGATTASSNNLDPTVTQNDAIATALNMFKQNTILDQGLSTATQSSSLPLNPAANSAQLYFQFLDPVTRKAVPLGSTNGKIIQVTAAFGFVPVFGGMSRLGTGVFPIIEMSNGGLPMLDVVLCFDISSSMDDFTNVSVVSRYKTTVNKVNQNAYKVLAQNALYNAFGCTGATGTALNATFPQNLDANDGKFTFSASSRGANNGAIAPSTTSTSFTDVVVNIDGTATMSNGVTVNTGGTGYSFPAGNIGVLVEAARGNLESTTIATAAGVPWSSWGITPKQGYYDAYVQAANAQRHPIADAVAAAQNFFTIMNNDADVHFGLVTFSSNPGTSTTSTVPGDYSTLGNITDNAGNYSSNSYPKDPYSPMPPNPEINLNPTLGPSYSNYSTVCSSVQNLEAYGGTNISGALDAAINQLAASSQGGQQLCRKGATKAIVLFTDGLPTSSSTGSNPSQDARAQAVIANKDGIPIYCIGLCMVPSLQSSQTAILTDQSSNASTGGIAGISGNGAQFYQATDATQLNRVFENVARALVQLVR